MDGTVEVIFHNVLHQIQSQAPADFTGLEIDFGGKAGIENLIQIFCRDAGSVVGDAEDIAVTLELLVERKENIAVRSGFHSIGKQIPEDGQEEIMLVGLEIGFHVNF